MRAVIDTLVFAFAALLTTTSAQGAGIQPFPKSFRTQEIQTDGATIHVRVGGSGPAVVLLHGFGDTGDMWAPLAASLAADHTVVVPDLRGMGLSSHPPGGYDKKTQAADVRGVLTKLGIDHSAVVGHDIGTMVAYAYAARYPDRTDKLVVMDAPVPGIPPWDQIVRSPQLWHFLSAGRMPSVWWRDGSGFIWTGSGMSSRARRPE
jgi:pimeloyl-ACP methyl ester carboxylesterase